MHIITILDYRVFYLGFSNLASCLDIIEACKSQPEKYVSTTVIIMNNQSEKFRQAYTISV